MLTSMQAALERLQALPPDQKRAVLDALGDEVCA